MRFRVLGPMEVRASDGSPVSVGGPRVRSLLALLLLDAGHVVTVERLIDGLYGAEPPAGAPNALQSQVSRLRRGLGTADGSGDLVEFHPAGYRLAVDPGEVDALRFERLARDGRRALTAGDPSRAAALLREGLDLWRGPALADMAAAPFAEAQAARLEDLRLETFEDYAEALLALGDHRDLVIELREPVAAHPLRERLRGLLMRALYGGGRQAEALAVFEDARRTLADQLGADPSPELVQVHLAILRADPSLTAHPPRKRPPGPREEPVDRDRPADRQEPADREEAVHPEEPAVREGAAGREAPASRETAARGGLAAQLTSFVGRQDELARIGGLLAAERLVTLVGPGGTGKTRLAVEAGGRAPGEVRFVDLAAVERRPEDGAGPDGAVAQAVIDALGVREAGLMAVPVGAQSDPAERLVEAIADRALLLILDNCEHVIDEAARLVHRLLGACPGLRVLATSREALGITGEALCPLTPLAAPPPEVDPADALAYPAARLFADRAAAVRPGLELDAATVAAVARICAALDGLPLAIELAAARLRTLTVDEVAARLGTTRAGTTGAGTTGIGTGGIGTGGAGTGGDSVDSGAAPGDPAAPYDRFRLLSRGDRTKAPRHRTLRAVVQWSWDLLGADERLVARRLTVFAGGATPEAVARVCGLAEEEADDLLTDLADKSLVEGDGGRYRMLDTIREFCAERLAEAGEAERARAAHAAYFFELAESAEPHLRRADQLEWLARLNAERGNLLAALRLLVHTDHAGALRMLAAMSAYWWLRGLRSEGASVAIELLALLGDEPPPEAAEEYALCVMLALHGGGDDPAVEYYRRRIDSLMADLGSDRPTLRPMSTLLWALNAGPSATNTELQEARMGRDPWSRALRHFGYGYRHLLVGDLAGAEGEFARGEAGFRAFGDRWGLSAMLGERARLAVWRGDWDTARALLDEAYEHVRRLDSAEDMADCLQLRGEMLIRRGDLDGAGECYEHAHALSRRSGGVEKIAETLIGLGEVARLRGHLAEARRHFEAALSRCTAEAFIVRHSRAMALIGIGRVAEAAGDVAEAGAWFRRALAAGLPQRDSRIMAHVAEALAGPAVLGGEGERAALLLGSAAALRGLSLAGDPDVARVTARGRELLGAEAFAAARARGAAMSQDQVVALLTAEIDEA
ncbi:AfsR/SARP family transcriptional regulator [Actinoallomurus soli]|uniref:AfsR/SARP family transcriptional regulator n=1 Tax=Actinoallomurus soli TaxID=2952535 RepID=UPI002092AA5F|nr:BTAD domain-containing putative transcriptional regulator [Actinoallomurus soli]MCO5970978.1 tetratricopeptide repeat protein [Actinoallomurus soli]